MAKGKSASGKHYTSKGERKSSISTRVKDAGLKMLNQMKALEKGKNIRLSLPNIDKNGKVHPNTIIKVDGREWLKRRQGGPMHKEVAE
jgi:hypothetical protein